jgi:hypothetical protein
MERNLIVLLLLFVWSRIMIVELWLYIVDFKYLRMGIWLRMWRQFVAELNYHMYAWSSGYRIDYKCIVQ